MIKFGRFIAKHRVLVLIIALLLLIPSVLGYAATRVNYDILTYLPNNIDTMVGQEILQDEFGKGASMAGARTVRMGSPGNTGVPSGTA